MDREISYYGTGQEENENELFSLQKAIKIPGRTQLNIAIVAAAIAIVLAVVCGYFAYSSGDHKHPKTYSSYR